MDPAPTFLERDELLAIHRDQLQRYGGFMGIRDEEALNTTLAAPEARMKGSYIHEDLPGMAAAYLYHVARYRPFVDGNQRTAVLAALVFLGLNNIEVTAADTELAALAHEAATGTTDRPAIVTWLRQHTTTIE